MTMAKELIIRLHDALRFGDDDAVVSMLCLHPELRSSQPRFFKGDTPLHYASRSGSMRLLLKLFAAVDVNATNNDGKTALHESAIHGFEDVVRELIAHNANVDALKQADWTPLMLACTKQNLKVIKFLVESGASLRLRNKDGWNAFHIAVREGHMDILNYLLSEDPECWNTKSRTLRTPLHTAALHGHTDALRLLLSLSDGLANSQDSCGTSPIMDALRKGFIQTADILIKHGASLTLPDSNGRLPVHVAAESGEVESMKFLLTKGASVNATDANGSSPLHLAAKEGHVEMVKCLLSNGADATLRDFKHRTALMIAEFCKRQLCVELLKNY